jgi:DNA polymerase phi
MTRKILICAMIGMTQAAISFKLCVLDFIEIFLRRQPTSPLVFESILPIMNVMSQHPQIESRSISVLTHRIGKLSEPVVNPNIDTLIDVAKRIFQKMHKNTNAEFQSLCNKLLAQLVRSVLHDRVRAIVTDDNDDDDDHFPNVTM